VPENCDQGIGRNGSVKKESKRPGVDAAVPALDMFRDKDKFEGGMHVRTLRVEYAKRGTVYCILFFFSLFCEYINLEYVRILHVIYRVHQAEYIIRTRVFAPQEYANRYSTRRVRTAPCTGEPTKGHGKGASLRDTYTYTHARAHTRTHTHKRTHARARAYTHTKARTCTCPHTHMRTHAHVYARARAFTHTHTHTHTLGLTPDTQTCTPLHSKYVSS